MIGQRLGSYEITAKLGEGGMGEVYRATDTKLEREVAIKVLPSAFTEDTERLARFEREAKLLAQLHHPNIASIFGLEDAEGIRALVMELVEGPTLADRLESGGLSLDESLTIAREIAEALEEAHDKGIVHRDLKPQNIKAPTEGKVKVLDFGLAKAMDPASGASGSAAQLAASPTLTLGATMQGLILGTAAYMAPEQAKGLPVDKRADIWAFGVVLYEMLAGRRLFTGDSVPETLAGVLKNEIDLAALPAGTPRAIRRLLGRCLERNPRKRLRDIGDARLEIDLALAGEPVPPAGPSTPARRATLPWTVAGVLGAACLALVVWTARSPSPSAAALSVRVTPLTQGAGLEVQPTISPDGKMVAYASNADGDWDVYVVRSTGGTAINLTASSPEDDFQPAFSPDGERIAFRSARSGGGIFVMGATGESARRLTEVGYNPSWSPDGRRIVFSSEAVTEQPATRETDATLSVVDVGTGAVTPLPGTLDAVQPAWSPHGHRIAYWGLPPATGQRDLWTVSADGGGAVRVTEDADLDWSPTWSPDGRFLYFSSDRGGSLNLWRVVIDEKSGKVLSQPEAVTTPSRWCGQAAFAADGVTFVYTALDQRANAESVAFDPVRRELADSPRAVTRGTVLYASLDPSPDGAWLALATAGRREDLFLLRLADGELRRLTDDAAKDRGPVWAPDGGRIAAYSDRGGTYEAWSIRPDGSGLEPLAGGDSWVSNMVFSPEGSRLVATNGTRTALFDLSGPLPAPPSEELPPPGDGEVYWPTSWSADGRRIVGIAGSATTGETRSGLVVYSVGDRTYRKVGDLVTPWGTFSATPEWLPDDRHLIAGAGADLMLVDSETGAARRLLEARAGSRLFSSRLTRDGRALFFLRLEEESDLWIAKLEEGP
jgi:Tol biopolymer transport system component